MKFIYLFMLFICLTIDCFCVVITKKDNGVEMFQRKAVYYYDLGKLDSAAFYFHSIAITSDNHETKCYAWLNIVIIENEKNNTKAAKEFLLKAEMESFLVGYHHEYISNCVAFCNLILQRRFKEIDILNIEYDKDPSYLIKNLFLWQLSFFELKKKIKDEKISSVENRALLQYLKKELNKSSLRQSKILYLEALINIKDYNYVYALQKLSESNEIIKNLDISTITYLAENVRTIFYYMPTQVVKHYNNILNAYENVVLLLDDNEVRKAVCFYKARYYFEEENYQQSYFFIKEAYELCVEEDPNIVSYLAYVCEFIKDDVSAVFFYNKLKKYKAFQLQAYIGLGNSAYRLRDTRTYNYYTSLIIRESRKNIFKLEECNWILKYLIATNQYNYITKFINNYIEQSRKQNPKNNLLSIGYIEMANYLWKKREYEDAMKTYHMAILALLPRVTNSDYYTDLDLSFSISKRNLIIALNNKGEAFYQLSKLRKHKEEEIRDLKASYKNLHLSIEQMYALKMQQNAEEQKYFYSDLTGHKYPNIIKVCLELYNKTGELFYKNQAFAYAEQSKATIMLSMLRSNDGSKIGLIPPKFKTLEDSLDFESTILNNLLRSCKNDSIIFALNAKLERLAQKRTELERVYQKQYPSYYNLKYSPGVIQPGEIQKMLSKNECIVEYLLSKNFLISYYIDNKKFIIRTDTLKNVNLADLADDFYRQVYNFSPQSFKPDSIKSFARNGTALYNILLKPFEKEILGKNIILVPDNSLGKIPFEALPTSYPKGSLTYKTMPYLIKKNTVYYAPSITFLHELRKRPVLTRRSQLLAAAPVYSGLKLNDTISRALHDGRSDTSMLNTLPNAQKEISYAHSMAGGRLLMGGDASETEFKAIAKSYDILHLATHGILNTSSALQSKLLFADSDGDNDGFLHTYEIYNLEQSSQLVILSACNTGAGKNYGGEGIISLARGFLSSGSRSVIMTLWSVNDLSSYELIKGFYDGLKEKRSVCEALRESKLDYLSKADNMHSHPFFWTGYVIYGDASIHLMISNNNRYYIIALIICVIGLIIWKFNAIVPICRKLFSYKKSQIE